MANKKENLKLFLKYLAHLEIFSMFACALRPLVRLGSLKPSELQLTRLLCPWNSSSKNTGGGCYFLLQGIFRTQESNLHLLHCRHIFSIRKALPLFVVVQSLSCVRLFETLWTVAHQASLKKQSLVPYKKRIYQGYDNPKYNQFLENKRHQSF